VTTTQLPFERSFREWIDRNEMGWERLDVPLAGGDGPTSGYRFTPAGRSRRRVVALHGAGNDALFAWIGLFKRLLAEGSEILTFDLPGHGRHSRTRLSARTAIEAVNAAVATCAASHRALPVHAIGVSLGGSLLLAALPGLTGRLASATLIVAPLRIEFSPTAMLREIGTPTLRLLWREREHYGLTGLVPSFGPFKREVYPLRLEDPPPPGAFGYVEALNRMLEGMRIEAAAREVDVPVLLVYGDRDRIVPLSQGERIHRALPRSELLRVPGGTHLSTPLETVTTERVLSWIEEHP
jgi:alpha-beta hydrolase superfamily lysophospholipase